MSIIGSNILAGASGQATGYNLTNSLRFRSSNSANLARTPASATNKKTWTWSGWVKRGALSSGSYMDLFSAVVGANDITEFRYHFNVNDDTLMFGYVVGGTGYYVYSTNVFRDPSAWYHLVCSIDTTQATSTNRVKIYVNGNQVTQNAGGSGYPLQNVDTQVNTTSPHNIGYLNGYGRYFDGYMTEINFVDGTALTPSSFGETSATTGQWIPKRYTGSYGTNGFKLNFSDASAATAAAIGKDSSGNGNNWTPNNISVTAGTTYDAMLDVPTNTSATVANYATLNPVYKAASQPTFSNANLTVAGNTTNYQNSFSTIAVTSGKWYAEILITGTPNSANMLGVSNQTQLNYFCSNADVLGTGAGGTGYGYYFNGKKYSAGIDTTYGAALASGDILGIALDLDNGKIWFSLNGTWQASGDPAAGTNAAFTGIASDTWSIGTTSYSTGATSFSHNFGQRPFSYTPPTGFVALNTYNLPDSTIKKGNTVMDATLYTGTGSAQTIVNAALFKPDLVWGKARSTTRFNVLVDSVRGSSKDLYSNSTSAEFTDANVISSINSNGFSLGTDAELNLSANTFVAWQWQAGQGTTSSNTSGSITSTVSVNTTAGFSVFTYTGNATANATIGHGLGVAPKMFIVKPRSTTGEFLTYHVSTGKDGFMQLQDSAAFASSANYWGSTGPTSTTIQINGGGGVNNSGTTYVVWCWAEIAGFSKFGSYTGNGSADGPFVFTGFRPKFIMIKRTDTAGYNWPMMDTTRDTYNVSGYTLYANLTNSEDNGAFLTDILSNGFKLRNTLAGENASGGTYIYMAFAESPFKSSLAR